MKREEFAKLLEKLGMSKKDFSDISEVPYPTVQSWGSVRAGKRLEVPNWVRHFLKYYEKAQKFDLVAEEICEKLSSLRS